MATEKDVSFLGAVPINMRRRANSDRGDPSANFTADEKLANELESVVKNLAGQISIHAMSSQTQQP